MMSAANHELLNERTSHRYRSGKYSFSPSYSVYLFCMVILPIIPGELFFDAGLWVSLHLLISVVLTSLILALVRHVNLSGRAHLFFMFPGLMVVLTAIALAVSADRVIIQDLYEFIRPFSVFVFLIFGIMLSCQQKLDIKKLVYYPLAFVTFFFFILFVGELMHAPLIGDMHSLYFRDKPVLRGKFVGSFFSTYVAGLYFVACFSLFFARALLSKSDGLTYFGLALCCVFLVLHTQSRSAFLALVGSFIFIQMLALLIDAKRGFVCMLSICSVTYGILALKGADLVREFAYLSSGIDAYLMNFRTSAAGNNSLGLRIQQFFWALENNPYVIFGAGILKDEVRLLESWFALYYFRYGLLGLWLYIIFWAGLLVVALRAAFKFRKEDNMDIAGFMLGFAGMIIASSIALMSFVATDFMKTIMLWTILAGLCISLSSSKSTCLVTR